MKQNARKPPNTPAKKAAGTKAVIKKKKRRKLNTKDRVRAILVAAVLILAAVVSSLAVVYFRSARNQTEAAAHVTDPGEESKAPGVAAPAAEPEIPEQAPAPIVRPAAAEKSPATEKPVAKPTPPAPGQKSAVSGSASVPEGRPDNKRPIENRAVESRPLPAASSGGELRPVASVALSGGIVERPAESKGTLAFVIDDAGYNLRELEPFLDFPGPLTIAVLPGLPYSVEAARRIRAAGKEVFLHQPMEAIGGQNPGPGAIRSGMGRDEIRAIISRNLDELGPVAGINNHEGSRVTMDEQAMETILALCRERGILFLDSRTTAESAAPRAARLLGMSIGERDVFVDNVQERESMIGYINTGLQKAQQKGTAIMIGHVWSPKLAPLLTELFPDLKERGYTFSSVSKIIGGTKL